jgi:hypothetical protein
MLACALAAGDLESVKSEPKLEKRSELALRNAELSLDEASAAYQQGNMEKTRASLNEVRDSVDLSYQSLLDTGKDPRRNSRYFKNAEKATRQILRRLDGLKQTMSFVDHEALDPVLQHVSDIHDSLVRGIMGKKK